MISLEFIFVFMVDSLELIKSALGISVLLNSNRIKPDLSILKVAFKSSPTSLPEVSILLKSKMPETFENVFSKYLMVLKLKASLLRSICADSFLLIEKEFNSLLVINSE